MLDKNARMSTLILELMMQHRTARTFFSLQDPDAIESEITVHKHPKGALLFPLI